MSRLVFALMLLAAAVSPAAAAGRWTTFIRPYTMTDAWAGGDSVWIATAEAGAMLFRPSLATFERVYRQPDGLASNQVTAVTRDRSGRTWFGTDGQGLSVRTPGDDGRFGLVNALDGLPSPFINALHVHGDTLWIATDGGLALWNGDAIAGALPDGVNPSPFASNVVTAVTLAGDSVWVGTENGVYVSRVSTGISSSSFADVTAGNGPSLPSRSIRHLASDGASLFVTASDNGSLFRWDFTTGQWLFASGAGFAIDAVSTLSDDGGVILATTTTGTWRWDGAVWQLLDAAFAADPDGTAPSFVPSPPFAGTVDDAGRIWIAGRPGLFAEPDAPGAWPSWAPDVPVGNNLVNVLVDGPRTYIAAFEQGFGRWDGTQWRNWPLGFCTAGCDTTFQDPTYPFMLHLDRDGVKWVAFWSTAIQSFDDRVSPPALTFHRPVDEFDANRHTFAWSAVDDSTGGHWFGMDTNSSDTTPIGIDYYDSSGTYVANYNPQDTPGMDGDQVRGIDIDPFGRLWVGYARFGIDAFRLPDTPGGALVQPFEASITGSQDVFGVKMNGDTLWVLTNTNLVRNRVSASGMSPGPGLSLPGPPATFGAVHPLDVTPDGSAWIATSAGVRRFKPGGGFEDFNVANSPLANDDVRSIRVDPATGVVWIATASGLNAYDPNWVPPPIVLPRLEARVFPNPAMLTALGVQLRVAGNAGPYHGSVYDLRGRVVRRFSGVADRAVVWDGRDGDGVLVRPGVYFVRVEAAGRTHTARVALLR